ncbi:MAG: carotenoid oxygenase family protein [candidate division KSB1 bacterium]|nr:carotenoid oxygenase family protein [candidate division KSB1 bacterium]
MSKIYDLGLTKTKSEFTNQDLPVTGKIPGWLKGTLFRNGPGTFELAHEKYRHWFDGLAMLHKFVIAEGKVKYSNKFLNCAAYDEAMATGLVRYSEFATDPSRSRLGKIFAVFDQRITDSAKVNLAKIAGKYLALGETSKQLEFDPKTMKALGVFYYEKKYKQHITTVHPQFDLNENMVYQLITRFSRVSHYRFVRISPDGRTKVVGEIPVSKPAYMHSFGLSPNYLILTEYPLVVQPLALLFQIKPFIENFKWQPKRGTVFHIMERASGKVIAQIKTDPFFAFHHINAFEQGDELVVDMNGYPDAEVIKAFYLDRMKTPDYEIPFGDLRRYRINLKTKTIRQEILSDECLELSNFDYQRYQFDGNYRFVYGVSINKNKRQGFYNQLVKFDLKGGQTKIWFEEHSYPGEPIFVGMPYRTREDDGVLLSVILDERTERSYLLILDAESMQEIARAEVPQPILFGYHGAFWGQIF